MAVYETPAQGEKGLWGYPRLILGRTRSLETEGAYRIDRLKQVCLTDQRQTRDSECTGKTTINRDAAHQ